MKIIIALIITLFNLLCLPSAQAQATSVCRLKNGTASNFDPAYDYCDTDLGVVMNTLKICQLRSGEKRTYHPKTDYCDIDLGAVMNTLKICEFGNGEKLTYLPQHDGCDPEFGIERQHHKFCKIPDGRGIPYDTRSYKCIANYGVIPITHQLCDRGAIYPFNPAVEKCEGRLIEVAGAEKDPKEKRCGNYDKSKYDCHLENGLFPKGYQFCTNKGGSYAYNPANEKCSEGVIMSHHKSVCKSTDGEKLTSYDPSHQSCCDGEVRRGLDACFEKPDPDKGYCPRVATGEPLGFRNALIREAEERTLKLAGTIGSKVVQSGSNVSQPGSGALEFAGTTGGFVRKLWNSPITKYAKSVYDSLETQMAVMGVLGSGRTNMITAVESIRGTYQSYSLQTLNSSTANLLFSRSVPEYSAMISSGNLCVAPSATNSQQFEFHFYNVNQQQCKRMMQLLSGFANRVIINNKYGSSQDCIEDKAILYRDDIPRNYLNFIYWK